MKNPSGNFRKGGYNLKNLFLIRHAKSDWDADFDNDHGRPLSDRGKKNAKALSKFLSERDFSPAIAYVSDSRRTIQTHKILSAYKSLSGKTIFTEKIYEASLEEILSIIRNTNEKYDSILLVGHNPGLETFVNYLLGNKTGSVFAKFSTSAFASFDCEIETWNELKEGKGKLNLFWTHP